MKRVILAGAAGILAVGAVSASAATLGGITGGGIGADNAVVESCNSSGVAVGYTLQYDGTNTSYNVANVVLSGIDAPCNGLTYFVTLADDSGVAIGNATGVVSAPTTTITNFNSGNTKAQDVEGIAIAITSP